MPCSPLTEWMRAPTPTTEARTSTRPTTSSEGRGRQGRGVMRGAVRPRGVSVRGVGSIAALSRCDHAGDLLHGDLLGHGRARDQAQVTSRAPSPGGGPCRVVPDGGGEGSTCPRLIGRRVGVRVRAGTAVRRALGCCPTRCRTGRPWPGQVTLPPSPVDHTTFTGVATIVADTAPPGTVAVVPRGLVRAGIQIHVRRQIRHRGGSQWRRRTQARRGPGDL